MSSPGNLPDTETLARGAPGRRCPRCRTALSEHNRGRLCWPCQEREQMESLGGRPRKPKIRGEPAAERQRVLRSLLPATHAEIRLAQPTTYPHDWKGCRRLSRDLAAIGARPDGAAKSPDSVWSVDDAAGMAPGAPPKTRESPQITAGDRAAVPAALGDDAAEIARIRAEIRLAPLSPDARAARRPPPPDELVGALQDRVHVEKGRLISSMPISRQGRRRARAEEP